MMKLYDYQENCVNAIFEYLKVTRGKGENNPIVQVPTGGGKSLIQAHLIKHFLSFKKDARIISLCHMTEIIKQNFTEFMNYTSMGGAGIYCGKLGRKDKSQILFSSIQSVYKSPVVSEWFDIAFIDEAHLCNNKSTGIYRAFLDALLKVNPRLRVIGMTATPWRMDGGCLMSGDQKLFHATVYQITLRELIDKKKLVPIVTPKDTALHTPNLDDLVMSSATKDFTFDSQQSAMMKSVDPIMEEACEILKEKKKIIVFCPTIIVCEKVLSILISKRQKAALFIGSTSEFERLKVKNDFEKSDLKYLISVNALTTGFNVPCVDAILCLRATASSSLWIQILGRGMRISPRKENCLLLDYGDNINRHGPVELIESPPAKQKSSGKKMAGEFVFIKKCPNCEQEIPMQSKICHLCNYEYPVVERKFHPLTAGKDALFIGSNDTEKMFVLNVLRTNISHYIKEDTKSESLRVDFFCSNGKTINKFFKFEGPPNGKFKQQAIRFVEQSLFNDGRISQDIEFDERVKILTSLVECINKSDYKGFCSLIELSGKDAETEKYVEWQRDQPEPFIHRAPYLGKPIKDYFLPDKIKVDFEEKYPQVMDMIYDSKI